MIEALRKRRRPSCRSRCSGVDSDNDSAFMSQTVFDYCKGRGLEQTRSRAYKKNDQAWVEQKNGAVVRRLVGYGRLSGLAATKALARAVRVVAAVHQLLPALVQAEVQDSATARACTRYTSRRRPRAIGCSPRRRSAERREGEVAQAVQRARPGAAAARNAHGAADVQRDDIARAEEEPRRGSVADATCQRSSQGLASAWKDGEVRPTHRKQTKAPH